jgi:hypothetical protein
MTDPAGAMRAIRRAIKPDGTWLMVDINGKPTLEENYPQSENNSDVKKREFT